MTTAQVLSRMKALAVSKFGLDIHPCSGDTNNLTWEDCLKLEIVLGKKEWHFWFNTKNHSSHLIREEVAKM